MSAVAGALVGAAASTGLLLAAVGWRRVRRPSPADRIDPYLGDLLATSARRPSAAGALYGPWVRGAARRLGSVLGGSASVRRRLQRLGSPFDLEAFRLQQLVWGALGFGVAAVVATLAWTTRGTPAPVLLVLCASGLAAGVLGRDTYLSSQVRAHEQRLSAEFPAVADLLALAVAAGESPVAGLERVLQVSHGGLGDELATVLADVRTGRPVPLAFDDLAARTGVAGIARFAEALAVAVERGTPLVDVLHAQTADVREGARRELVEIAGRREILMMIPVVFLVLPVTVVFAFYPGLVGLRLVT